MGHSITVAARLGGGSEMVRELLSGPTGGDGWRLRNEWVPKELARWLLAEGEDDAGASSVAVGKGIERMLLRSALTQESLEIALLPGVFSPRFVYPAHYEVLRDVLLFLLGRTDA